MSDRTSAVDLLSKPEDVNLAYSSSATELLSTLTALVLLMPNVKDACPPISESTSDVLLLSKPQLLMVGEQGLRERVQVTPLDGVNIEGGTQGITLNIQGNVLHESFVEDSIIPQIREGLRLGENMGI